MADPDTLTRRLGDWEDQLHIIHPLDVMLEATARDPGWLALPVSVRTAVRTAHSAIALRVARLVTGSQAPARQRGWHGDIAGYCRLALITFGRDRRAVPHGPGRAAAAGAPREYDGEDWAPGSASLRRTTADLVEMCWRRIRDVRRHPAAEDIVRQLPAMLHWRHARQTIGAWRGLAEHCEAVVQELG